jgi:hypothetical protein
VTGERAEGPEEAVGGGFIGDRFVGDATDNEERLRDNAAGVLAAERSAR